MALGQRGESIYTHTPLSFHRAQGKNVDKKVLEIKILCKELEGRLNMH
jgi:hypothetical protein